MACTVVLEPVGSAESIGGGGIGGQVGSGGLAADGGSGGGQAGRPETGGLGGGDAGGTGGTGQGGTGQGGTADCPLIPNEVGWVNRPVSDCQIQGSWFAYNDCPDSPEDCTRAQLPGEGSFPNTDGVMCTVGTTAPATAAELETKWGAGIALNLNEEAVTGVPHPIGEMGVEIRGFRFTLSGNLAELRVNFPTANTLTSPHFLTITANGEHEVWFSAAQQGDWVTEPSVLAWEEVFAIQFMAPNREGAGFSFDYCVSDLTALR